MDFFITFTLRSLKVKPYCFLGSHKQKKKRVFFWLSSYQYQYNGKEFQDELGLDWYDYGARNYDASLARFMNLDPKAEQYNFQSPYVYANNSPIQFMDINGEGVDNDYGIDKNGYIKLIKKTDDKFDRLYVAKSDENGNAVLDEKGNAKKNGENHIIVQNQYLLSGLSVDRKKDINLGSKGTGVLSMSYAKEDAKNDVFNIFKFASDNSNAEWSVAKIGYGESSSLYNIGTYHNPEISPGASTSMDGLVMGVVHSHPNIELMKFKNGSIDWKKSIESSMRGDAGNYKESKVKYKNFVYFPQTKGTYRIRMSTDGLQSVEAVKTNSFRF